MIDTTFDWYIEALKGNRGQIDADNPMAGFYRTRGGRGRTDRVPVAFWYHEGELRCHKSGKNVDDMAARELWPHASKDPVTSFAYWEKMDTGKWPDDDEFAAVVAGGPDIDPEADPVGSLKAEIDGALAGVKAYATIESDEDASKAQTLRSALTTLSGKADKLRTAEKEPHLQASRDVDAKWQPLVKTAKEGADKIRTSIGTWNDVKLAAAKAAKEAQDKLNREAEANGLMQAQIAKPNAPAPSTTIRGGSGRAAHVGIKKVVTEIDIDKAFKHFRNEPELYGYLLELSQRALNSGISVEGATIIERSDVR